MHMRACENLYSEQLFFFFRAMAVAGRELLMFLPSHISHWTLSSPSVHLERKNVVERSFSLAGLLSGPSYTIQ